MKIMVVKREILFGNDYFEGFRPQNEVDYKSRILKNFKWMERIVAENNPSYKQPIAYIAIINLSLKQVFVYQRSSKNIAYLERRLQGKWSWGLGGHIEKLDFKENNPILASRLRELKEEVEVYGSVNSKMLGYINNDSDEVGKVHFGILYVIETNARIIKPKDPEIENGTLMPLEGIERIYSSPDYPVEEWSRISLIPLKTYMDRL